MHRLLPYRPFEKGAGQQWLLRVCFQRYVSLSSHDDVKTAERLAVARTDSPHQDESQADECRGEQVGSAFHGVHGGGVDAVEEEASNGTAGSLQHTYTGE